MSTQPLKSIRALKRQEKPKRVQSTPSDHSIKTICTILLKQEAEQIRTQRYARVKDVLTLLGAGAAISAAFLAPGSTRALKSLLRQSNNWDEWKRFNASYLRRTLKRLEQQKVVEVTEESGQKVVRLAQNGRRKILKYSLDALTIDAPKNWDGKWRLVLYDIPIKEKAMTDILRDALRALGFYPIQDSVYIVPYPCFDQIEFLREYYALGDLVQYMLVDRIERDQSYKDYFGLF